MSIQTSTACPICRAGLSCSCQLERENGVIIGCSKCVKKSAPQPSISDKRGVTSVRAIPQQWWKTR